MLETFALITLLAIHDGDTFSVNVGGLPPIIGQNIRIRMRDIDAPELTSKNKCEAKKAIDARDFLRKKITNKKIILKNVWRDKYFRLLADVEVDGILINSEMIKQKLAIPYDSISRKKIDWCRYGYND